MKRRCGITAFRSIQCSLLAGIAAVACVPFFDCAGTGVKVSSYQMRQVIGADSLLYAGKFEEARARYEKICASAPASEEAKTARFRLAYLNVYFKNPEADWDAALREFKTFSTMYPDDPRISDVLSWIRVLTVIKSFDDEFKSASSQVKKLKIVKTEARITQRYLLDSIAVLLRHSYESRDSLEKKNIELERFIIDLEKKCQQAGR